MNERYFKSLCPIFVVRDKITGRLFNVWTSKDDVGRLTYYVLVRNGQFYRKLYRDELLLMAEPFREGK